MEVVGIKFNEKGQVYYFTPGKLKLKKGVTVIVDTEKGLQFGKVEIENKNLADDQISSPLKNVLRVSTKKDYSQHKKNLADAKEAVVFCKNIINEENLNMYIVDASYTFNREQLIFRFFADNRIDFRNLAKRLANQYKTRIELRQIGVRDKAREVSGYGSCGQPFCCSRFLKNFETVSISMAKNQNLALNPTKINGSCGRLKCCLNYEDDCYRECRKDLPKIGTKIKTNKGEGIIESVDVLKGSYIVNIKDVGSVEIFGDKKNES